MVSCHITSSLRMLYDCPSVTLTLVVRIGIMDDVLTQALFNFLLKKKKKKAYVFCSVAGTLKYLDS